MGEHRTRGPFFTLPSKCAMMFERQAKYFTEARNTILFYCGYNDAVLKGCFLAENKGFILFVAFTSFITCFIIFVDTSAKGAPKTNNKYAGHLH
ncbi:hypothetical protein KIN20_036327 [Parelaphostrongylus tenuis]|uniref:Uncharacterized protein n=1 Tax=Parelaphostrongylus tenuis TaxID=148309 RepID=A0AAD5RCV6_PARTN|nr:hypothetical protein KIN20_036327 [Parelaphostrongylus tenuis]